MRIIFQDGGVAELTNVEKIVLHNEMEGAIASQAVTELLTEETKEELTNGK